MSLLKVSLGLAALAFQSGFVLGHGTPEQIKVNGVRPPGDFAHYKWHNHAHDFGFIDGSELQTRQVVCNRDTDQGPNAVPVNAGDEVELDYYWPKDGSHKGPLLAYMANCNGPCDKVDRMQLEFVKIQEAGLVQAKPKNKWATDVFIENDLMWKITIPSDFKTGNYVLRSEIVAMQFRGKQWFMACVNLNVTGTGNANPKGVRATELYKATDPSFQFMPIENQYDSYPIPGPPLYVPGGSSNKPASSSSSSAAAPSSSTGAASGNSSSTATKASTTATSSKAAATTSMSSGGSNSPSNYGPDNNVSCKDQVTVTSVKTVTVTASPTSPGSNSTADAQSPRATGTYASGRNTDGAGKGATAPSSYGQNTVADAGSTSEYGNTSEHHSGDKHCDEHDDKHEEHQKRSLRQGNRRRASPIQH